MILPRASQEVHFWTKKHFQAIDLGDIRRNQRVQTIVEAAIKHPSESIPQLFEKAYDVKAVYNLFSHPEVTVEKLQAGHRQEVMKELNTSGTYLLLEDTSTLSWKGDNKRIEGLGPTSGGNRGYGFHMHSVLATRWPSDWKRTEKPSLSIIGLADQQYYVRKPRPQDEKKSDSHKRKNRARESQRWWNSTNRLGPKPENQDIQWIRVADREADIYEYLLSCQESQHRYVIRAAKDRVLEGSVNLLETVRSQDSEGQFDLSLRGRDTQPSRIVTLSVCFKKVLIPSPRRPGKGSGKLPSINCSLVRVWEATPSEGTEALEWILLCSQAPSTFEEALECILQYASRWAIEDFHRCLKSGLKAEKLQLETAERLFNAIALKSVVALRLLGFREQLRIDVDAPASQSGLSPLDLETLSLKLERSLKTVKDVALAVGRLGGHMNRKSDGMPGLVTLWRGMDKLYSLVEGAVLWWGKERTEPPVVVAFPQYQLSEAS